MNTTLPSRAGVPVEARFERVLAERHAAQLLADVAYPAPERFASDVGEAAFVGHARASNDDPIPPSLSLCLGRPFAWAEAGPAAAVDGEALLRRLCREIERVSLLFDRDRSVQQLHLGRGVADVLDVGRTLELIDSLSRHFALARDGGATCSIEIATLPGAIDGLERLTRAGFNRLCGIVPELSGIPASVHAESAIEAALAAWARGARSAGFAHLDARLDLDPPLPRGEAFIATLRRTLALTPDRVLLRRRAAPPAEPGGAGPFLDLFEQAVATLESAGLHYLGLGRFVRADDPLWLARAQGRLRYDLHGFASGGDCDLLGLGPGAFSRIGEICCRNTREVGEYCELIDQGRLPIAGGYWLSDDDLIRRDVIQRLVCEDAVDIAAFSERHRIDFRLYFAAALQRLQRRLGEGVVQVDARRVAVLPRGRYLLPAIAACFGEDAEGFRTITGNTDSPDTP